MNAYWKIGLILACAVAVFLTGWQVRGWKDGVAAAKLDEAQQAATIAAQAVVAQQEHKAETLTIGVSNDYQKSLTALDSRYSAFQLQPETSAASNLPSTSAGTGGRNADTCANGFSGAARKNLIALVKQADIQTARLRACQQWVLAQGEYLLK